LEFFPPPYLIIPPGLLSDREPFPDEDKRKKRCFFKGFFTAGVFSFPLPTTAPTPYSPLTEGCVFPALDLPARYSRPPVGAFICWIVLLKVPDEGCFKKRIPWPGQILDISVGKGTAEEALLVKALLAFQNN